MLFMVHYQIEPKNRDMNFNRLDALGGDGTVPGIELRGTWPSVTMLEGWAVFETDDILAIGNWMRRWTNLNVNTILPIVDWETLQQIMTGKL